MCTTDTTQIISVWSAHGHTFIGDGSGRGYESCLTCGGLWQLVNDPSDDDPTVGRYTNVRGDDPIECDRATDRHHGYVGERPCDCHDGCPKCVHNCNCLSCDS